MKKNHLNKDQQGSVSVHTVDMCSTRDEMRQEETNLGWDPSIAFLFKKGKKVAKKAKKNKKAAAWNPRPVFFSSFWENILSAHW